MDAHIQSANPFRDGLNYRVCPYLIEIIEIFEIFMSTKPILSLRCNTVMIPLRIRSLQWEENGICIGFGRDLLRT